MRVLLTDIMFPNKYAKWRLVEIKSFIEKYDCDIMVTTRINSFAGNTFDFDYELLCEEYKLFNYDILIFNPEYNTYNKYNDNYDGTIFNNLQKCDYVLRHKKYRNNSFCINDYNILYHIFLMCYEQFNHRFYFPMNKQFIHLYPGGGVLNENLEHLYINNDVKIVSTQNFITTQIKKGGNEYINSFGGPFFNKNQHVKHKIFNEKDLCVCFTSMGDNYTKGAHIYVNIVDEFYKKYLHLNIKFISIGNCNFSNNITSYPPMNQNKLSDFYYENVDILFTLNTNEGMNGFPLGVEAGIEGCVLLTTDPRNQNIENNFNIDNFYIIDTSDINTIIDKIALLTNKDLLKEKSIDIQNKLYELFNYDNTMGKIFDFIEKT
jgi:hypothetical protein